MINTLRIGEIVYHQLSGITSIGTKVYPMIAENSTTFPFIIYTRDSLESIYSKDGLIGDVVSISVKVVSATYNEGIDIAQQVRERLNLHNLIFYEGNKIDSKLVSATESYEENSYIQTLTFSMEINN